MITAIIIDDEPKGRLALRKKLSTYCSNVQIMAEASNGKEALVLIQKHQPQLIFLDIEMPVMNGFEMLNAIGEKNFHIIFTTAYDQYAITAIRYAAFDYLLKPVDIEELITAVGKISGNTSSTEQEKKVETLNHNLVVSKELNKIAIPTADGLLFFEIGNITRLEAHSNYTHIFFRNRSKLISAKTLKDFEELLPQKIFFRAHHSHVINMGFIKKYSKGNGGKIELMDGTVIDLSRRKRDAFTKILGQ